MMDLVLVTEKFAENPYTLPVHQQDLVWEAIVKRLSMVSPSYGRQLHSCKVRISHLLKKHVAKEGKHLSDKQWRTVQRKAVKKTSNRMKSNMQVVSHKIWMINFAFGSKSRRFLFNVNCSLLTAMKYFCQTNKDRVRLEPRRNWSGPRKQVRYN